MNITHPASVQLLHGAGDRRLVPRGGHRRDRAVHDAIVFVADQFKALRAELVAPEVDLLLVDHIEFVIVLAVLRADLEIFRGNGTGAQKAAGEGKDNEFAH